MVNGYQFRYSYLQQGAGSWSAWADVVPSPTDSSVLFTDIRDIGYVKSNVYLYWTLAPRERSDLFIVRLICMTKSEAVQESRQQHELRASQSVASGNHGPSQ